MTRSVVVYDYGSGNVHSAVKALAAAGADATLTGDRTAALEADGLLDAVEGEVRAQASFLNHVVDFLTARARVSDGLGRSVERREYARAAAGTASTRSAVASAGSSGADMTVGRIG